MELFEHTLIVKFSPDLCYVGKKTAYNASQSLYFSDGIEL